MRDKTTLWTRNPDPFFKKEKVDEDISDLELVETQMVKKRKKVSLPADLRKSLEQKALGYFKLVVVMGRKLKLVGVVEDL